MLGILCSSSNANRIPLHVYLVYMYMYMAIKLSIYMLENIGYYCSKALHIIVFIEQHMALLRGAHKGAAAMIMDHISKSFDTCRRFEICCGGNR